MRNHTERSSTGGIEELNFFILAVVAGACASTILIGQLSVLVMLRSISRPKNFGFVALLITLFNCSALVFAGFSILPSSYRSTNCGGMNIGVNVVSHLMYCLFDVFLLFKTFGATGYERQVLIGGAFVLLSRIVWSACDVALSGGRIVGPDCIYYQDPVTGVGSNAADIAADAFCTFAVILHHRKRLSWTFDTLNLLIRENILRSSIVASFNSVCLYITVQVTDAFTMEMFFILQICVYSVLVNGELLFIQARQSNFKSRASSAYESGKTPPY